MGQRESGLEGRRQGRPGVLAGRRRDLRPRAEGLEDRQLLATLAAIGTQSVLSGVGLPVVLAGGASDQTYTVTSSNSAIKATVVKGSFLKIDVSHASSGAGDEAFTGSMVFQLFSELTPNTVSKIVQLVQSGFYTSPTTNPSASFTNLPAKNWHRVASGFSGSDFIVQGGSVNGDGTGDVNLAGFPFDDEFVQQLTFTGKGQLAMANSGDDTNSSQFFVTTGQPRFLDYNHTIFAQLVSGSDVVTKMTQAARDSDDAPKAPILFTATTLSTTNPNGVVLLDATSASAGQTSTITVTATDPSNGSTTTQAFTAGVASDTEDQRPFLGPVTDQVVGVGQTSTFKLSAVSTEPTDTLTYRVGGASGIMSSVTNATATVDAQGNVTVTPTAGFTGTITLTVGVRDQTNRSSALESAANYDTQRITVRVISNVAPTAHPQTATVIQNTPTSIQLSGDTGNSDTSQTLTYTIVNQTANGTISNFDASTGKLTYTPKANFLGSDSFTFRVRDSGQPTPNLDSSDVTVTLSVQDGTQVNLVPNAKAVQQQGIANTPVTVQLLGDSGNPNSSQTITYTLNTSSTLGSISNFDASAGTFTYTPPANFVGNDTVKYTVTDHGDPTPNLTSESATVTLAVAGDGDTNAVRQIGNVLLITPPPGSLRRPTPNSITVSIVNNQIVANVNGLIDTLRPSSSAIDRVVVYGSKAGDTIVVSPEVPQLVTLDGGRRGINNLQAGDSPTRLHGWFGWNNLRGGASDDQLIGRLGRVRFYASGGQDLLFAGERATRPRNLGNPTHRHITAPTGQFFRFFKGKPVPIPTPRG